RNQRRWNAERDSSGSRAARYVQLRSGRSDANDWRTALLRRAAAWKRSARSASCGSAERRAGVYDAGVYARHGSDRADQRGVVCGFVGGGHGFYGEAGGRVAERVRAEFDRWNFADAK